MNERIGKQPCSRKALRCMGRLKKEEKGRRKRDQRDRKSANKTSFDTSAGIVASVKGGGGGLE